MLPSDETSIAAGVVAGAGVGAADATASAAAAAAAAVAGVAKGGGGLPARAESIGLGRWWRKIVVGYTWARNSWTMGSERKKIENTQNNNTRGRAYYMRDRFSRGQYIGRPVVRPVKYTGQPVVLGGPARVEPGSHGPRCQCHGLGRAGPRISTN